LGALCTVLGLGCVGDIGDAGQGNGSGAPNASGVGPRAGGKNSGNPSGSTPGSGSGSGSGAGAGNGGDPLAAGPMPVRRLTQREYENTVRDLLGAAFPAGVDLQIDSDPVSGFRAPSVVSPLEAERLRAAAEALALAASKNLGAVLPCTPSAPAEEAVCARSFAETFGTRAFRRPPSSDEIERLVALYQSGRQQLMMPFSEAIGLMLEGMLQSAAFVYRWELGPGTPIREGDVIRLGPYEIASRLSYFLLGSMPDDALFGAAAGDELSTSEGIEAEVRRLLGTPRAKEHLAHFFEEWLGLEHLSDRSKDPTLYPEFTDALKEAMLAETRAFATEVLFAGDGRLGSLLGASFSMVNGPLATLYGAQSPGGQGLSRVELDPAQRAGLLTQGSFLALTGSPDGSNPIVRGKDVFLQVLCKELPPPPPEVPAPKPASEGVTTRQRFEEHGTNACATGCHQLFDIFGFAFEHYDGIGRYRTTDSGQPVDAGGTVELDGQSHPFDGARELSELLAQSQDVQRCVSTQFLRFAFRRLETQADAASLGTAFERFAGAAFDVRELLVGLGTSRTFRYRSPNPGEVMP